MTEPFIIIFLAFLGCFTAFYGTIVGGAGLLVIPVLIHLGLSPQEAIATGTTGYIAMALSGLSEFYKARRLHLKFALPSIPIMMTGAVIGSLMCIKIPADTLKIIIGTLVVIFLILSIFEPKIGTEEKRTSKKMKTIGYILFIPIGIIAALTGGGAMILANFTLILCFGETYIGSAGTRKPIALAKHLTVATMLGIYGLIIWPYAVALLIGNSIGAFFGSRWALNSSEKWIRWLFIAVTSVSAVKLFV